MPGGFDVLAPQFDGWRGPAGSDDVAAIARLLGPAKGVLDVGGGTGRYAAPLQERGYRITVVDPSRGMMEEALKKGVRTCVEGRAEHLPFRDGSVDAVLFVEMLHLMPRWVDSVHEMGRVARDRVVALVKERVPDGRKIYMEARQRVLGPSGRLDEGVRAFRRRLPPAETLHVRTTSQSVHLAKVLEAIEQQGRLTAESEGRAPRELPPGMEEVLRVARQELRDRFGPGPVEQVERVDVLMWPSETLRRFVGPTRAD